MLFEHKYLKYKRKYLSARAGNRVDLDLREVCEIPTIPIDLHLISLPPLERDNFDKEKISGIQKNWVPKYLIFNSKEIQKQEMISRGMFGKVYKYGDGNNAVAVKIGDLDSDSKSHMDLGDSCDLVQSNLLMFYVLKMNGDVYLTQDRNKIQTRIGELQMIDENDKFLTYRLDGGGRFIVSCNEAKLRREHKKKMIPLDMPSTDGDLVQENILVMRLMQGSVTRLYPYMRNNLDFTLQIMLQIIDSLNCLIEKNFFYTDIKPDNFLYTCVDGKTKVYVGDLGGLCQTKDECSYTIYPFNSSNNEEYMIWCCWVMFFAFYLDLDWLERLSGRQGKVDDETIRLVFEELNKTLEQNLKSKISAKYKEKIDAIEIETIPQLLGQISNAMPDISFTVENDIKNTPEYRLLENLDIWKEWIEKPLNKISQLKKGFVSLVEIRPKLKLPSETGSHLPYLIDRRSSSSSGVASAINTRTSSVRDRKPLTQSVDQLVSDIGGRTGDIPIDRSSNRSQIQPIQHGVALSLNTPALPKI